MPYAHPIDRLVVKLRPALIVSAALFLPVFLFTYALMLKTALTTWPWWGVALTVGSHLTGWLGLSALIDSRQQQTRQPQDGQF